MDTEEFRKRGITLNILWPCVTNKMSLTSTHDLNVLKTVGEVCDTKFYQPD